MQIFFAIAHGINRIIGLPSLLYKNKNKEKNLPFDKEIKGKYIIRQSAFNNIRFGVKNISYNGCGIIALHNIQLYLKREKPFSEIIYENEKNALLYGIFGLSPYGMRRYLLSNGVRTKKVLAQGSPERAFIHFYFRKNLTAHYVAAIPENKDFRFLNSSVGSDAALTYEQYRESVKKEGVIYECVYVIL